MSKGLPLWARADAPEDRDLLSLEELERTLADFGGGPASLLAAGDVMLADRARRAVAIHGSEYPFRFVRPLLSSGTIVLANHEGPFVEHAPGGERRYVYRIDPAQARAVGDRRFVRRLAPCNEVTVTMMQAAVRTIGSVVSSRSIRSADRSSASPRRSADEATRCPSSPESGSGRTRAVTSRIVRLASHRSCPGSPARIASAVPDTRGGSRWWRPGTGDSRWGRRPR